MERFQEGEWAPVSSDAPCSSTHPSVFPTTSCSTVAPWGFFHDSFLTREDLVRSGPLLRPPPDQAKIPASGSGDQNLNFSACLSPSLRSSDMRSVLPAVNTQPRLALSNVSARRQGKFKEQHQQGVPQVSIPRPGKARNLPRPSFHALGCRPASCMKPAPARLPLTQPRLRTI